MDSAFNSSDYIVLMAFMKICQTFREGSYTSTQQCFVVAESYFSVVSNMTPVPIFKLLYHHQVYSILKCKANGRHQVSRCCGFYYKVLCTMCFFDRPGFKSREFALVWHKNEMNEGTEIICNRMRIVLGARQVGSVWKNEHDMIK